MGQMLQQAAMSGCASVSATSTPLGSPSISTRTAGVREKVQQHDGQRFPSRTGDCWPSGDTGGGEAWPGCCWGWTPWAWQTEQETAPSSSLQAPAAPGLEKTLHMRKCLKLLSSARNLPRLQHCGIYTASICLQAFVALYRLRLPKPWKTLLPLAQRSLSGNSQPRSPVPKGTSGTLFPHLCLGRQTEPTCTVNN